MLAETLQGVLGTCTLVRCWGRADWRWCASARDGEVEKQREDTSEIHPGSSKGQGTTCEGGKGAQRFQQIEEHMQKHANGKEQGTSEKL